jgi:hypothetical protein
VAAPDNVGDRRSGATGRLRGSRRAARAWRTGPGPADVLRPGHLRGPAVHRGDLQRPGGSRAPRPRAVIAPGLIAGSGTRGDRHPHPEACEVIPGRGRVHPGTRAAAQARPRAGAVTLAVAGMVAAFRVVGSWSRLPGGPLWGFQPLAGWWPLGSGIERLPEFLSGFRMIAGRWCSSDAIVLGSPGLGASRRTSPPDSAHAGCGVAPRQHSPVLAG